MCFYRPLPKWCWLRTQASGWLSSHSSVAAVSAHQMCFVTSREVRDKLWCGSSRNTAIIPSMFAPRAAARGIWTRPPLRDRPSPLIDWLQIDACGTAAPPRGHTGLVIPCVVPSYIRRPWLLVICKVALADKSLAVICMSHQTSICLRLNQVQFCYYTLFCFCFVIWRAILL